MRHSLPLLTLTLLLAACMPTAPINPAPSSASSSVAMQADVELTSPLPNTTVTSPLSLTGRARGMWYFEASFPVELQDAQGNVLAQVPAQAQGDWMTTDFVPFTATLTFPAQPAGSTGVIILRKDNPSGLPQNEASITVPVQF